MKNKLNKEEVKSLYAFIAGFDVSRQIYQFEADSFTDNICYDEAERLEYIEDLTFEVAEFFDLEKKDNNGHMMFVDEQKLLLIHSTISDIMNGKTNEVRLIDEANNLIK